VSGAVSASPAARALVVVCSALLLGAGGRGSVVDTVHNLSVTGPGEIRALNETEICKFCHIPHNSVERESLWSRELPQTRYAMPSSPAVGGGSTKMHQPDGSSRLCLSCHDGTVALGEIGREPTPVAMAGARRLGPGRRGYLGTDLSGSHPISFTVPDGDAESEELDGDMGIRPRAIIESSPDVRLDEHGKMQCSTCHDAHADVYYQPGRVPRFWVRPTVEEVCLTCHELR
jgi:hypothetical protein